VFNPIIKSGPSPTNKNPDADPYIKSRPGLIDGLLDNMPFLMTSVFKRMLQPSSLLYIEPWRISYVLYSIIGQEEFEDTKGVIRIRKKNRQHNDYKKKDIQRSTKHTHKTN